MNMQQCQPAPSVEIPEIAEKRYFSKRSQFELPVSSSIICGERPIAGEGAKVPSQIDEIGQSYDKK
jgi:hypothetical protein